MTNKGKWEGDNINKGEREEEDLTAEDTAKNKDMDSETITEAEVSEDKEFSKGRGCRLNQIRVSRN